MKIGIDARFYSESGVGRYLRNLIYNLQILDKKNQYSILLLKKDYEEFQETENFTKVLADFRWYGFAEQFKLPSLLRQFNFDLVHFPHFNVPVFYTGKFVVTIHDLIHQHRSMKRATMLDPFTFKIKQLGYKKVFKAAIGKSRKILVPSKSVQQLLIKEWSVDIQKIIVTPEAVDDHILEIAKETTKTGNGKILRKFNIQQQYIFFVGNAHPHKNVEGLIKVFLELRKKYDDLKLVLAGNDHYFWQRIKKENQQEGIIYTGFVTDEEMVALYKEAQVFVMPSFEEGFGIPLLEAMACSCPVVASKTTSLPEVGGEVVLYFDPENPADMAKKIAMVLDDQKLRLSMIKKGLRRYRQFSWQKLAEQTLEVYSKCV